MTLIIKFEMPILPPSVNILYKRAKFGHLYQTKRVVDFKEDVKKILSKMTFEKSNKNIKVIVKFFVNKKNIDLDNLLKCLLDSLNKLVYEDDKQIIEIHCKKLLTTKLKKTEITIYEHDENEIQNDDIFTIEFD